MKTSLLLRASLLTSTLGVAFSAHASVTYTFISAPFAFRLTTPNFITTNTTFLASQLDASTSIVNPPLRAVSFNVTSTFPGATAPYILVDATGTLPGGVATGGVYFYYFSPGSFSTYSTYADGSRLLNVSAVPEPSTLLALGLPALALLRRRKRS